MARRTLAALCALVIVAAGAFWWLSSSPAEREVRRLFADFAAEFNGGATSGFGTLTHIARLSDFFAPDVVVELGHGSAPIRGRETLMGMATRLQPRTAAFVLEIDDVTPEFTSQDRAEVTFTAVVRQRSLQSGEESIDAREFAAEVVRSGGKWRMSKVVAIDTLR